MTPLTPPQRLVLEATRLLAPHSFLAGPAQTGAENQWIWTQAPEVKNDVLADTRKALVKRGLLARLDNGRLELTPQGTQALETGTLPGTNGNGSRAKEVQASIPRSRHLPRIELIQARGNN